MQVMPPSRTSSSRTSPHAQRLRRLARQLARHGASHLLVTDPADVGYLTGFLGGDSYLLVPAAGKPTIISDFRYQEELDRLGPLVRVHIRSGAMMPAVGEVVSGVDTLAFQAEHLTVAQRDALAKLIGARKLVSTTGLISELRAVKDDHEVRLLRKAIRIQEASLLDVLPTIEPGQTEAEIAGRLEGEMKRRGASGLSFDSIVAAKANGSLPHYRPALTKTAANQPVLIDWGARVQGYGGDMTRTFSLGRWPARLRDVYAIVLDAHLKAADSLREGAMTTDVDRIAREHITRHGYGDCFGHGLGHGLGINVHEQPRLSHMAPPVPLKAGNVVTIEPGVYLPGVGGVRIEDDYLVTARGSKNLCSLPKTLAWATLA